MTFDDVDNDACMHGLTFEVADDLREHYVELMKSMFVRRNQLEDGMPNVVLAALTVLWLEAVHSSLGTIDYESAISILRDVKPKEKGQAKEMRSAARDFLRRAYWLPKRRSK